MGGGVGCVKGSAEVELHILKVALEKSLIAVRRVQGSGLTFAVREKHVYLLCSFRKRKS